MHLSGASTLADGRGRTGYPRRTESDKAVTLWAVGKTIADEPFALEPDAQAPGLSGPDLARARRRVGMTQRELADRLGVRLWMVEQWESGAKPIPADQAEAVAAAVGAPAGGNGDRPSGPLTAQEIREAQLPRSLRGYDEASTRRLLGDIAAAHERSVRQCDELRQRVEDLTTSSATERDALVAERDGLRTRVDELERAATPAAETEGLRRRVEELEQAVAGYEESERSLSRALVAASRAGEELRKEAEEEAQGILVDARRAAEKLQRELDDRLDSFESERVAILEELKREALASARDDLVALEHSAEPLLEALAAFEDRIRAFAAPQADEAGDADLLDDLKAPSD